MVDLGLEVRHDTVALINLHAEELKLTVDALYKSLTYLIDIYGPLVLGQYSSVSIENLKTAKKQAEIYRTNISMLKTTLSNLDLHLRGYDSVCSLVLKELREENEK